LCKYILTAGHAPVLAGPAGGGIPTVDVPVTMNEMLLRGCMLRNTEVRTGWWQAGGRALLASWSIN
jgi:hypothetical protein